MCKDLFHIRNNHSGTIQLGIAFNYPNSKINHSYTVAWFSSPYVLVMGLYEAGHSREESRERLLASLA